MRIAKNAFERPISERLSVVLKKPAVKSGLPGLDLSTVRDTLAYIQHDLQRVRGLEMAAEALQIAISEVERAGRQPTSLTLTDETAAITARLFPRKN